MQLVLYTTEYCQLCEEAQALIYSSLNDREYELKFVDISESDELMACYALRIPVLAAGSQHSDLELDWPFGAEQLIKFVKELGKINDTI